ncbi:hypothetical protein [Deinococcus yavapaiensis]|uniref:hypothetical protein n=1 Tax=Deinococcus yavapaiensis TaxID=309889 RepID=UPI001B868E63|nr:hypothetical protein [Deinococcus yavapaiensis]
MTNAAGGMQMNRASLAWLDQHILHDKRTETTSLTLRHDERVAYEERDQMLGDRHSVRVTANETGVLFAFQQDEGKEVVAETDPWPPTRLAFHAHDRVTVQDEIPREMKFDFLQVHGRIRCLRGFSRMMVRRQEA